MADERQSERQPASDRVHRRHSAHDETSAHEEPSVGEWQRIALARALLREAQVIVLDEPTSATDAAAEYEMFKRFRDVAAGRTAILISHRLSTVKMADRVYVVRAGRVVESGTHDELLRSADAYADLFTAQAGGYQ